MSGVSSHKNKLNGNITIIGSTNNNITTNKHSNKGQHSAAVKHHTLHQPHHLHHQLNQQQSVNIASNKNFSENNVQPISGSQLQTIATIHNHHHQQQPHQLVHQVPTAAALTSAANQRQNHHLQLIKNNCEATHTIISPRYQPHLQGGILKHLNPGVTERQVNKPAAYFAEINNPSSHLNIKYPPDIPQLSAVYIPDTIKAQGNPSRFQQVQQRLRTSSAGGNSNIHLILNGQQHSQKEQQDMLKFVRKSDQDPSSPNNSTATPNGISSSSGRLTAEQNRQLQSLITELRVLKEANQRLIDDNQELRDLCCFLDDDRQKGRKLAREWQRFGRYTASVMRQEVSAYQNKLRQLDDKQQELITDNLELKELCLYLDEERAHVAAATLCVNCGAPARPTLRDDGDGSSSSTNAEETMSAIRNYERNLPDLNIRTALSDQTLQYVRSLERRVHQLEEERLAGAATSTTSNIVAATHVTQIPEPISGRPEAVVRALQVLEVREQLERDRMGNLTGASIDQMDDGEKALVREMCNVVWRKLEGSPNGPNGMEPL